MKQAASWLTLSGRPWKFWFTINLFGCGKKCTTGGRTARHFLSAPYILTSQPTFWITSCHAETALAIIITVLWRYLMDTLKERLARPIRPGRSAVGASLISMNKPCDTNSDVTNHLEVRSSWIKRALRIKIYWPMIKVCIVLYLNFIQAKKQHIYHNQLTSTNTLCPKRIPKVNNY